MNQTSSEHHDVAKTSFEGSEGNTLTVPDSVKLIANAGFKSYLVDYRSGTRTYHHSNGETFTFKGPSYPPVDTFDADAVRTAIKEAQLLVPGYTYQGFCRKVTEIGGTAGYLVSVVGKRVLYFGANGDTYTERFPDPGPRAK
jgi:uncharacterized protein YbcV (DUF1398 family)